MRPYFLLIKDTALLKGRFAIPGWDCWNVSQALFRSFDGTWPSNVSTDIIPMSAELVDGTEMDEQKPLGRKKPRIAGVKADLAES